MCLMVIMQFHYDQIWTLCEVLLLNDTPLSINYLLHLFNHVWVFMLVHAMSYIRSSEENLWDLVLLFYHGVLWTTLSRPYSHWVVLPAPQFSYIFRIFLLELFTHVIVNWCLSFTGSVHLLLLKSLPFDVPSFLYPRCSVSPDLFPCCHGLSLWLFHTFLFHHLPHPGTAQFKLSLCRLSFLPTFPGFFFSFCPHGFSSTFIVPIYDFQFYDSNLCLQYLSLWPLSSGPHL